MANARGRAYAFAAEARAAHAMSHLPLLAKHAPPPRLQPPPRAPRVVCLVLLLGVVLIVLQPPLSLAHAFNTTHALKDPPPPEMHRLLEGMRWEDTLNFGGIHAPDGSALPADYLRDLLVTVRYLANRALSSR